jgi:hypothetical protein
MAKANSPKEAIQGERSANWYGQHVPTCEPSNELYWLLVCAVLVRVLGFQK